MLKVLIADDEPFILQGLKVLIDWNKEGFENPVTAADGQQALDYVKDNPVDLIISDIKMPNLSGLGLLKAIREEEISDAYFVILSGYAEFSYAQEALRYDCADYVLKPVEKDGLLAILRKVAIMKADMDQKNEENFMREKAYLDWNIMALLNGKYEAVKMDYIKERVNLEGTLSYVTISLDLQVENEDVSDEDRKVYMEKIRSAVNEFLKEDAMACVRDMSADDKNFDIGFLYNDEMAKSRNMSDKEYFSNFYDFMKQLTNLPITFMIGKSVNEARNLSKSYGTSKMLKSIQGFREKKAIYYYEEECLISDTGVLLCKSNLDELINAIELNEHNSIRQKVDGFYQEMLKTGITKETMNLNINYLLFQLIHLATELDNDVNQEEILRLISESTFEEGIRRGSKHHISRMACEYGDYLAQLRKNVSKGVLGQVEDEVKNNYASNLTLKDLSEKYFVNSAYLGQLFRKKYGCSFKDYLNSHRMNEAAKLLLNTDMKIYQVAESVGFKDVDYFVNRFITAKGCTPAKYRKQ